MDRCPQILPECYADTLLIEILCRKIPNHQLSIGEVANAMLHKSYKNQLAIGVIDADKKKPAYFLEFNMIESFDNIELKQHPDKKHYAIIIAPAFELFVKNAADEVEVDLATFGFKDMKQFRNICKNINVGKNQQIKQLLNTINQKQAPSTEQIKTWINNILPDIY